MNRFLILQIVILIARIAYCQKCKIKDYRGNCRECESDYYQNNIYDATFNGKGFDENLCLPKMQLSFDAQIFVSACSYPALCNSGEGTMDSPYTSLITALVKTLKLSQQYSMVNLRFFLLEGTHFIMSNQIPYVNTKFFKNVRGSFSFESLFCSYLSIAGCLPEGNAVVYMKTDGFRFVICGTLTIKSIKFMSFELHYKNSSDSCSNEARTCCEAKSILNNTDKCYLYNKQAYAKESNDGEKIDGLFTFPALWVEVFDFPSLQFNLMNCSFQGLYSINDNETNFNSLIKLNHPHILINFVRVTFADCFMRKGLLSLTPIPWINIINPNINIVLSEVELRGSNNFQVKFKPPGTADYEALFYFGLRNLTYNFINVTIVNLVARNCTIDTYLLSIGMNTLPKITSNISVSIKNCEISDSIGLGFMRVRGVPITIDSFLAKNITLGAISLISLTDFGSLVISASLISGGFFKKGTPSILVSNISKLLIKDRTLVNNTEFFSFLCNIQSQLNISDSIFNNLISDYFISNSICYLKIYGSLFSNFFLTDIFVYSLNNYAVVFNNSQIVKASTMRIFNLVGVTVMADIFIVDSYFKQISSSYPAWGLNQTNFLVWPQDNRNVDLLNVTVDNCYSFSFLRTFEHTQNIRVVNSTFSNMWDQKYFLYMVLPIVYYSNNENSLFQNVSFVNMTMSDYKYLILLVTIPTVEWSNMFIFNISYNKTALPSLTRKVLFVHTYIITEKIKNFTMITLEDKIVWYLYSFSLSTSIQSSKIIALSKFSKRLTGIQFSAFYTFRIIIFEQNLIDGFRMKEPPITSEEGEYYGGVLALIDLRSLSNFISIKNNIFQNIYCPFLRGGAIAILRSYQIKIEENYFLNCTGALGGSIYIREGGNVLINNNIFNQTFSRQGGAIYSYLLSGYLTIKKIEVYQAKAESEGGAICISACLLIVEISSVVIVNACSQLGAALKFDTCSNVTVQNITATNIQANTGAFLFLENVNGDFKNITVREIAVSRGGFLFARHPNTSIIFNNITASGGTFNDSGAFLYSSTLKKLLMSNILVKEYFSTVIYGKGIVFIMGMIKDRFYIGNFTLENFTCEGTSSLMGSCLLLKTNNLILVSNLKVLSNIGSPISIQSDRQILINLKNLLLVSNNLNTQTDIDIQQEIIKQTRSLVHIYNANITVEGLVINENMLQAANLNILSTDFEGFNISIVGLKINEKISESLVVNLEYSSIFISTITFDGMTLNKGTDVKVIDASNCAKLQFFRLTISNFSSSTLFLNKMLRIQAIIIEFGLFFNNTASLAACFYIINSDFKVKESKFSQNHILSPSSTTISASDIIFIEEQGLFIYMFYILSSEFADFTYFSIYCKGISYVLSTINSSFLSSTAKEIPYESGSLFWRVSALNVIDPLNLTIENCSFKYLLAEKAPSVLVKQSTTSLSIDSVKFISINSCLFDSNKALLAGAIYISGDYLISIKNSQFFNNRAFFSPLLSFTQTGLAGAILVDCEFYKHCFLNLEKSKFTDNKADLIGGAITSKMMNSINLKETTFSNNSDFFNLSQTLSIFPLQMTVVRTIFEEGANVLEMLSKLDSEDIFTLKSGELFNFTVLLSSGYGELLRSDNFSTAEFMPTNSSKQNIVLERDSTICKQGLCEFKNARVITIPNSELEFKFRVSFDSSLIFQSDAPSNLKGESELTKYVERLFNIKIKSCDIGEIILPDMSCSVCKPGTYSFIDPMKNQAGSLNCKSCPKEAICLGGSLMIPMAGYWRYAWNSTLFHSCTPKSVCLGGDFVVGDKPDFSDDKEWFKGRCKERHQGPLCLECQQGSAKVSTKSFCEDCQTASLIYIKLSSFLLVLSAYVVIQVKMFTKLDTSDPHLAVCLRLFLNHFQTNSMVSLINFGWSIDFENFFNIQNYLSFLSDDFLTIDCFVQGVGPDVFLIKVLATSVFPILFSLVIMFFWMASFIYEIRVKDNPQKALDTSNRKSLRHLGRALRDKTRISFLVILYVFYPEVLRKAFNLLNCIPLSDLNNSESILAMAPSVVCWSKDHSFWVFLVAVPTLILWGLAYPLFLFYLVIKFKKQLTDQSKNILNKAKEVISSNSALVAKTASKKNNKLENNMFSDPSSQIDLGSSSLAENPIQRLDVSISGLKPVVSLGFLSKGYKNDYLYWETIMFVRKFSLILVSIMTEMFPADAKSSLFLLVMTLFTFLQIKCSPYNHAYLNQLELLSLFVSFATGNVGMLMYSTNLKEGSIPLLIFIVFLHLIFLAKWFYFLLRVALRENSCLKRIFRFLKFRNISSSSTRSD